MSWETLKNILHDDESEERRSKKKVENLNQSTSSLRYICVAKGEGKHPWNHPHPGATGQQKARGGDRDGVENC